MKGLDIVAADSAQEILAYGCDAYMVLHIFKDVAETIRKAQPEADILLRYLSKDHMARRPEEHADDVIQETVKWTQITDQVIFSSEDNNPVEGAGAGPDNIPAKIAWRVRAVIYIQKWAPWLKVWAGPYSPPFGGLEFYRALAPYGSKFYGICINAYGTSQQIIDYCKQVMALFPKGTRFWLTEFNFGAGNDVCEVYGIADEAEAKRVYAEDMMKVYDWCNANGVKATYFAYRWQADTPIKTTIDAKGQPIGEAIKSYSYQGVKTMAPVAVAILPSNQDKNKSPYRPDYSEYGGLHWLSPLVTDACTAAGLNALDFQTRPESQDTFPLENLIAQQERANTWLTQQPEQVKLLVNMHTDSGTASHTYGIYASSKGGDEGKRLAFEIGKRVHEVLATASFTVLEKLGSIDYNTYVFAAKARAGTIPVLIELCSHQNQHDIETFAAHPREVAKAIADGICAYAGVVAASSDIADLQNRVNDLEGRLAKIKEIAAV